MRNEASDGGREVLLTANGDDIREVEVIEERSIALYHVMLRGDGFEETAEILFRLVRWAARSNPGKPRSLYLDVDGHRVAGGGYDRDSFEIMRYFIFGFLRRWLTEMNTPLAVARTREQHEDVPDYLVTIDSLPNGTRREETATYARELGVAIYDPETDEVVEH